MKIENPDTKEVLTTIGIGLTVTEARELIDSLEALIADGANPTRHEHVSSADFQTEISLWIDRT